MKVVFSNLCGIMQRSELDVSCSLVHIYIEVLHQEPQGLLLASDSNLMHQLSPEFVSSCWRRLQSTHVRPDCR